MPRVATGSVYQNGGTWFARLTLDKRVHLKLSTCRTPEEAEARKEALAQLAKRLRAAGHGSASGEKLLKRAGEASGEVWDAAVEAIDHILAGGKAGPPRIGLIEAASKWWSAPAELSGRCRFAETLSSVEALRVPQEGGGVYFLQAGDRVRIGSTEDIRERFRKLSGASGVEPRLVLLENGNQDEERALHLIFRALRVRKEWFHARGALARFIVERRKEVGS